MDVKNLQAIVEKIVDYRSPTQGQPVQFATPLDVWTKLMAGLGGRVTRSTNVREYYETLRRYADINIINSVQERFLNHAAKFFNGAMPPYVVNVVAGQSLERYMASEKNSHAIRHGGKDEAGLKPPVYTPKLLYPPEMKEATVRLVMDGARALSFLRTFPEPPVGYMRLEARGEVVSPSEFFGADCPLLLRNDNGSSVMTAAAELLLRHRDKEPRKLAELLDVGIAHEGAATRDRLVSYYADVSYPFETHAKPLAEFDERVRAFSQASAKMIVRLDQSCGSMAGLIRATNLAKAVGVVGKCGVSPEFSDHVRHPPAEGETRAVCDMIDRLAASAYVMRLADRGFLSFPDIETGDLAADAEAARLHEECSAAAHRTVNALISNVVEACEEAHRASNRARSVARNIYSSMVDSVSDVLCEVGNARLAIVDPRNHEVTRRGANFPPLPPSATQSVAWSFLAPEGNQPTLFYRTVMLLMRIVASKL